MLSKNDICKGAFRISAIHKNNPDKALTTFGDVYTRP